MKLLITLAILVVSLNARITLPNNFTTNFKQTITTDQGKVIKYKGSVLFKNITESIANAQGDIETYSQNIFKWNYNTPTQKEVCTNGIRLTVIDHDLEQISHYYVDEGINLEAILKVARKISTKDYQATYKDMEYIITLDKNGQLSKIVYVDNLDNGVKIIFNNMHYNNASFNASDLTCQPPKSYDIIKG